MTSCWLQVDSVISVGDKVYSGGDKRIMVSDIYTGAVLHQVTRDTGSIPLLDKFENSLICCSASGAIRFFGLSFNVKRIKLVCKFFLGEGIAQILGCASLAGVDHVGALAQNHTGSHGVSSDRAVRNARNRRPRVSDVHCFGR